MSFRIAFIGVDHPHGAHWRQLLHQLAGEIEIVALVPAYAGGLTSLEERWAGLPRYDSIDDLLQRADSSFSGAVVCLPNDQTPAAIERLADAGKHLLVEKPCGGSASDFRAAREAVERNDVAFQNGYMFRYDEGANRLRDMVRDGRFGRLISVEMTYMTADVRRRGPDHYLFDAAVSGGGFFNWLACHYIDLLQYITDQSVVGVTARVGQFGSTPTAVEDGGTAILELAGGGLATLTGGYWLPRWTGENRWSLRGDQRWVHWHPTHPGTSGLLEIHGPQPQWHAMEETFAVPEDKTPGYGGKRGAALVLDWIAAARGGAALGDGRATRSTAATTFATLELLDAVYRSSREGRRVAIGD